MPAGHNFAAMAAKVTLTQSEQALEGRWTAELWAGADGKQVDPQRVQPG